MRIGVDTYAFGMLVCAVCAVGAGTYQTKYSLDARAAALQPKIDRLWESYEGGMSDGEFETRTNALIKANPSLAEHIQSYLSIRALAWQDESNATFEDAVEKGDIKLLARNEVSGIVAELWHVERRSDRVAVKMLLRGSDSVDIVSGSSRSGGRR